MGRTALWTAISDSLTADIAGGRYRAGDKLPTEAELATRFGVNRHTVRRALEALHDRGLTHARRGAGVFVASRPTDYPIGRRTRFHQNLRAAGQEPGKEILALEPRRADPREAEALELPEGATVHAYDGLSFADGVPIATFRSVFPADALPGLPDHLRDTRSVTEALARCGVPDYTRTSTRLTAKAASATQALHLRIDEGAPILRSVGINVDPDGRPVEYGRTWFAGDRVTLVMGDETD